LTTFSKRITGPTVAEGPWPSRNVTRVASLTPAGGWDTSPTLARMATRPRAAATATAAALVLLAGCTSGGEEQEPPPEAASSTTPSTLADADVTSLPVQRGEFCGLVAEGAPQAALDGEVDEAAEYGVGEEAEIVPGTTDVSDEFSCTFTGADGTAARAWVFAPPVTRDRARGLVREARGEGCEEPEQAGRFGTPSVALVCREGERLTASYRGLFGDAWLACSVSGSSASRADLLARTEQWCLAAAEAAASGSS
jgi:hypothetical protein